MTHLTLRLDMRAPPFGAAPRELYAAGLEMAHWADRHGFDECMLSEHHGSEDHYLPSPLVLGAAIAARTQRLRIRVAALVLPLHDPLRIAEDVAVLDQISAGRVELVIAGGFVPSEFGMFDCVLADRGHLVEKGIETLKQAWTAEPFPYRGRTVRVTPPPLQKPHPPLLVGGSSVAAARRAARIADGFVPIVPELYPIYLEACAQLGVEPGENRTAGPFFLHVAEDPDRAWRAIAPHALHETNSYARWYAETGVAGPYEPVEDADTLRAGGGYCVVTPEECVSLGRSLGRDGWLFFHPLMGGLAPELGWESLELFASKVLPRLRE